ncbi:hypothetical protein FQA39_LY06702 [Lamprigera yunnana]|nr:hypothetical protein FQA39_LY06702 [Lamprigera yunnana]
MSSNTSGDSMESHDSCSSDTDLEGLLSVGMRSPGALSSGRTVKEIDEQLSSLKKENFNLKLRIYFLEERMGSNFSSVKEDIMKKNIELQVELANLQTELENKQELLCQAAKAMEIEEEENKKEICRRDNEIYDLKGMLQQLQYQVKHEKEELQQVAMCAQAFDLNIESSDSLEIIRKLQLKINELQEELKKEQNRTDEYNVRAKNISEKYKSSERKLIGKDHEITVLSTELEQSNNKLMEFNKRVNTLENILTEKNTQLEMALKKSTSKDSEIQEHKINFENIHKIYEDIMDERNKLEKKVEKYKWQCCISEKKNEELASYIDTLKREIHGLEYRLATTMGDVKRVTITETMRITPKVVESPSKSIPFKVTPSRYSSKLPHSPSTSPCKSNDDNLFCDVTDGSLPRNIKINKKQNECSPDTNDVPLTHDEIIELKKNHFKACKIIKTMIQKKKDYVEQIDRLQKSVTEKGDEIKNLRRRVTDMSEQLASPSTDQKKKSIKEKVSELNLTASLNPAAAKENSMAEHSDIELAEQYKELATELETKIEILSATLIEKDSQLQRYRVDVQEKVDRIVDLEFELLTLSQGINQCSRDQEDSVIEEKELQIKKLEHELRQRTVDLQGLVNKELWEKNRTIEKLQTTIKLNEENFSKLEKSHDNKELQLKTLKDKINELGIHINLPAYLLNCSIHSYDQERKQLIEENENLKQHMKNVSEHEDNKLIDELREKCKRLDADLDKSEKLRRDGNEICFILNNRLEELCYFLKSLLKHKSVFGFLGNERSYQLQETLDRSLEFSQMLSNSISCNAEESVMQATDISNLLDSSRNDNISFTNIITEDNATLSIVPNNVILTYHSHLSRSNNETDVISVLRQQIANLKHEIEVRDVELERVRNEAGVKVEVEKLSPQKGEIHSESESWSEPDRSVSLARIGLQDESLKCPNSRRRGSGDLDASTESTEDEKNHTKTPSKRMTLAESRQTIISLHEQVCELEITLKQKDDQLMSLQMSHIETEKLLKEEQQKIQIIEMENVKLQNMIADSDKQLSNLKIEQVKLQAQFKEVTEEVELVKMQKNELEKINVDLKGVITTLEEFKCTTLLNNSIKDKQMQNTLNEMEIERSKLIEVSKNLENALEKVKIDLQKSEKEREHISEREEEIIRQLKLQQDAFSVREKEQFAIVKSLEEDFKSQLSKVKESYEKDIPKCMLETNRLKKEKEQLEGFIIESGVKQNKLEEKVNDLHTQLDTSNLQCSEIILEKSKLKNENSALQLKIQKLQDTISYYCKKLSCLESQNLTIEAQVNDLKMMRNSLKTNGENYLYKRQISDHSGYVSEDIPIEQIQLVRHNSDVVDINLAEIVNDQDRVDGSASPDLGIESDQGRFSSLEANINLPRPFLLPLEIAQNMNDLLDPVSTVTCTNEECCKKAKQISTENVELRKRLLRTRRALEDTLSRLTIANEQKKKVEKSICTQIHKTSQVLRKAKANLDSGSETDNIKS